VHDGGSWEPIGVAPDLSAWSKAIANGYPLAAVLGAARYAEAAARIFVTGSFWFQSVPMAAAVATITAVREEGAVPAMTRTGTLLREGLDREAAEAGVRISQTGPVQIPNLSFPGDEKHARAFAFCAAAADHGVIFHPRHNWFLSAAHTESDVERALAAAGAGFRAVRERFGQD
jgi:glutamate-1-semialdehyde 2,1-aminomutase